MAKKTLTPEQAEIKAIKKAKKSENWTKFWAILLAAILTFGVVALGKTQADTALAGADTSVNSDANVDENVDNSDDDGDLLGGNDSMNNDASSDNTNNDASNNDASNNNTNNDASNNNANNNTNNNTNNNNTNNNQQQSSQPSKADVAKALNDATAKAAKASYKWDRTAKFTKNIDVGGLTSILDGIIKGVDENASLNSVVGGFLGIKENPFTANVTNGQLPAEGMEEKYLLKAMSLTENDIQTCRVTGNKYEVQIKNCTNPDANSAMAHATNDYITFQEVNTSIAGAIGDKVKVLEDGSQANYKKILFTAVIEDGKLTSLEYSYTFEANIKIKAGITANGSGAAQMNAKYSEFKY